MRQIVACPVLWSIKCKDDQTHNFCSSSSICSRAKTLWCWLMLFRAGTPHTGTELTGNNSVHYAAQTCRNRPQDSERSNSSGHVRTHIKHTNEGKTVPPAARSFVQTSGLNLVKAQISLVHLVKLPMFFMTARLNVPGKKLVHVLCGEGCEIKWTTAPKNYRRLPGRGENKLPLQKRCSCECRKRRKRRR